MTHNQDGTGQHIWLRYTTQYIKDGRTHTIEVGIPVPIGASTERRTELLHEAEIGLNQLVQHVEQRVAQVVEDAEHLSVQPIPSPRTGTSPIPTASASFISATNTAIPTPQPPVRPANRPASIPAPQTSTQPVNTTRSAALNQPAVGQPVEVPPTRYNIGSSMPTSLNPANAGSNLTIPEFITYISQNLHLDARQAMKILQVKSLSGINLRDALEYLKHAVQQQNAANTPQPPQPQVASSAVSEPLPPVSPPQNLPLVPVKLYPQLFVQKQPIPADGKSGDDPKKETTSNMIEMPLPEKPPSAHGFDEEVTEYEDLPDLEEFDDGSSPTGFSQEQREQACSRIRSLRERLGTVIADPARVKVLRNAADADVSDEQLQELANGIWHQPSLQKLKVDQVEALISWAKEDYFLEDVAVVLAMLKEDEYARSHW